MYGSYKSLSSQKLWRRVTDNRRVPRLSDASAGRCQVVIVGMVESV